MAADRFCRHSVITREGVKTLLRVFKYPFKPSDVVTIAICGLRKVLLVERQGTTNCLWALVDPNGAIKHHDFRIYGTYGTGHPIEPIDAVHHIASWRDGPLVWHMFGDSASKGY